MAFHLLNSIMQAQKIFNKKDLKMMLCGDAHTGGIQTYLPPNCPNPKRNNCFETLSIEQEIMYKNSISYLKSIGKVDLLIVMGDMAEGAAGLSLRTQSTDLQVHWGTIALSEWIDILNPDIILGVKGSQFHVQDGNSDLDRRIIERTSFSFIDKEFFYCDPRAIVGIGDKWWYFNHKINTGLRSFVHAALRNLYVATLVNQRRSGFQMPDVFCAGHIHRVIPPFQIEIGKNPTYGLTTPCLKITDDYLERSSDLFFPDIGFLYVEQKGFHLSGKEEIVFNSWAV
jgi:hypothetical protein